MSAPKHHPEADALAEYAAGTLAPAAALVIASHAALCPHCHGQIMAGEALGGILLEEIEPVALAPDALDQFFARIDGEKAAPPAPVRPPAPADPIIAALPGPVRPYARRARAQGGWRFRGAGIRALALEAGQDGAGSIEILKIAPGKRVPRHSHHGQEVTLVLAGGFSDETGSYGPGDLSFGSPDLTHQPIADPGEPCIVLAVTDAPLRLTGALGMIQRVIGGDD